MAQSNGMILEALLQRQAHTLFTFFFLYTYFLLISEAHYV